MDYFSFACWNSLVWCTVERIGKSFSNRLIWKGRADGWMKDVIELDWDILSSKFWVSRLTHSDVTPLLGLGSLKLRFSSGCLRLSFLWCLRLLFLCALLLLRLLNIFSLRHLFLHLRRGRHFSRSCLLHRFYLQNFAASPFAAILYLLSDWCLDSRRFEEQFGLESWKYLSIVTWSPLEEIHCGKHDRSVRGLSSPQLVQELAGHCGDGLDFTVWSAAEYEDTVA